MGKISNAIQRLITPQKLTTPNCNDSSHVYQYQPSINQIQYHPHHQNNFIQNGNHQQQPISHMHALPQPHSQQVVYQNQPIAMPMNTTHHHHAMQMQPQWTHNQQPIPASQCTHMIQPTQQTIAYPIQAQQQFATTRNSAAELRSVENQHQQQHQHHHHHQQPQQPLSIQSQPQLVPQNEILYQNNHIQPLQQQQPQQQQQHNHQHQQFPQQHPQPLSNDSRPPRYADNPYYNPIPVIMQGQHHQNQHQQNQHHAQLQLVQQNNESNHIHQIDPQNSLQQLPMRQESSAILNQKTDFIANEHIHQHQQQLNQQQNQQQPLQQQQLIQQNHDHQQLANNQQYQNQQQYQNTRVIDLVEQDETYSLDILLIMYDKSKQDLADQARDLQKDLDEIVSEIEMIRKESPSEKIVEFRI